MGRDRDARVNRDARVDAAPRVDEFLARGRARLDRGAIRDAFTVATALRAYHMAREGLLPGWLAHAMLTRA
jgi:hypothetical protein